MGSNSGKKRYTNGIQTKYYYPGDEPEGWIQGTDVKYRTIRAALKSYYNPETHQEIRVAGEPPSGFLQGFDPKNIEKRTASQIKKKSNQFNVKGKIWYNNGTRNIRLAPDSDIPEGFVAGKTPLSAEAKAHIAKAQKGKIVSEETKQKHSLATSLHHQLYGHPCKGQKRTEAFKLRQSQILSSEACQQKRNATCKKNNSFNQSKLEEDCYNYLLELYNVNDVIRQYHSDLYPFRCDFYIKSKDLYIECNFHWTHGGHKFDITSSEDLQTLFADTKKAETSKFYKTKITVWTQRDISKFETAEKNNLNYVVLYNRDDMLKYFNKI